MSWRTDTARLLPWVTYLEDGEACTGFMAHTPLKAIYRMGSKPPVGLDKYRCKKPAHWRFTALQRSDARDGTYCWPHLISRGVHCDELERARFNRWLARHPEAADA